MKKRVLITGGAGFIGSHLCNLFVGKGYDVVCMDNLITGNMDNIKHLLKNKNFKFMKHDVSEKINIYGKIDQDEKEHSLIITSIPYQTAKSAIVSQIAQLVLQVGPDPLDVGPLHICARLLRTGHRPLKAK